MLFSVLLLTVLHLGVEASIPERVVKNLTNSLSRKTQLDFSQPPHLEQVEEVGSCWRQLLDCWKTKRKLRQTLLPNGTDSPLQVSVDFDRIPQSRYLNIQKDRVLMHTEDSTWTTVGTDKGWNVGSSIHGSYLTISANVHETKHESEMKIKSLGITETCPPHHECYFETWFYHHNVVGSCAREATVICGNEERNACGVVPSRIINELPNTATADSEVMAEREKEIEALRDSSNSRFVCSESRDWADRVCWQPQGHRYATEPKNECSFRVPIREVTGKPLSTLVFVTESHDDEVPEQIAIKAETDCLFKLDSGLFYDSKTNKYSGVDNDFSKWVLQPDVPAPTIPDNVRLPDCPRTLDGSKASKVVDQAAKLVKGKTRTRRDIHGRVVDIKIIDGFRGFE